jgi:Histidine kinase-, DNA gyrase B-, and HSP90-like ATPase
MSIQPLPPDVIAQIKSSIAITSLNGVACELVKNSLDASSTKIYISVDYARGGCVIEDDGLGILPAEFREAGGLGKLYRKWHHQASNKKLTSNRFLQAEQPKSSPWRTWYFPCFPILSGSAINYVSPSSASFSQHHQYAQIRSCGTPNPRSSSTLSPIR